MKLRKKVAEFRIKYYQDVQKVEKLSCVILLYFISMFVVVGICSFWEAINTNYIYVIHSLLMIGVLLRIYQCGRVEGAFRTICFKRKMNLKDFIFLFSLTFFTNIIATTIVTIVSEIKGIKDVMIPGSAISLGTDIISIICSVIIAPIMEELMYRGIGLGLFKKEDNKIEVIIFTSVLFGLMHGNYVQFINAILGGFILGYVALKFGIGYSILLHMLHNGMIYVVYFGNIDLLIKIASAVFLFVCILNRSNIVSTFKCALKSEKDFCIERLFAYFLEPTIFLLSFVFGVMVVMSI